MAVIKRAYGVRSKGERLFAKRRSAYSPLSVSDRARYIVVDPWKRMRNMVTVLSEKGWAFAFRVEIVSATGFRYCGNGRLPTTAFLNAIGDWRADVASVIPKAVDAAKTIQKKILAAKKRPYRNLNVLSPEQKALVERTYRREYMRSYRRAQIKVAI